MLVQANSIVTCQVTSQTTFTQNADAVVQAASSMLASEGYGVLSASESDAGVLDTILSAGYISFQVTLQIQVPTAFGAETDVLSIVENAFYQVAGSYPTSGTVTSVTPPGGTPQATGLPSFSPTAIGGSGSGITSQVQATGSSLFSGLQSLGSTALIALAVLIIALVFVVGYSPNTRHVASAFA